jgi:shikimate dehydrogenase
MDSRTELYAVIGNPVRHSLSPALHNGAFGTMGLNAVYLAFEVSDLPKAMSGIRGLGIRGVSVTVPFKTQVIPFLDDVEAMAAKMKAVNTILNDDGRLIGYNTDWSGALEALEEKIEVQGKKVLLFGAGGAARAIGFGLKRKGCEVTLLNRSAERAEALSNELGFLFQPLSSCRERGSKDRDVQVVINATTVGMHPHDSESPVPREILREGMAVMDIVYRPLRTKLLREAEEEGCVTINGLEMLVRQGVGQLEIWTGKRPDLKKAKEDLRAALDNL